MTIKEIAELRAAEFMSDVNCPFADDPVEAFAIALEEIIDECKFLMPRECD